MRAFAHPIEFPKSAFERGDQVRLKHPVQYAVAFDDPREPQEVVAVHYFKTFGPPTYVLGAPGRAGVSVQEDDLILVAARRSRPVEPNPRLSPAPALIKATRKAARLTQTAAADLIYSKKRTWQDWEAGTTDMHPGLWELFVSKAPPVALAAPGRAKRRQTLAQP